MRSLVVVAATAVLLTGCASDAEPEPSEPGPPVTDAATQTASASGSEEPGAEPNAKAGAAKPPCKVGPKRTPNGTPRFWTEDERCRVSPWFAKAHRVMIYFGCTRAPYYPSAPRCPGRQGVHHGVDIDMPVGTRVFSHVRGRIVKGTLGDAYGSRAFLVRTRKHDFVIGHVRKALRRDGALVRKGERIAVSGQRGAPDGPHLHFEVRPRGGSYTQALPPKRFLRLRAKNN